MKAVKLLFVTTLAVVLGACSQMNQTPAETQAPVTTNEVMTQSTGDVDQDFVDIETELDKLDVEGDFPSLDADELRAE